MVIACLVFKRSCHMAFLRGCNISGLVWMSDLDSLPASPVVGVSLVFILTNFIGYSDLSL